jgi:hypothetical protein
MYTILFLVFFIFFITICVLQSTEMRYLKQYIAVFVLYVFPFGIYKLIEIIYWLILHNQLTFTP